MGQVKKAAAGAGPPPPRRPRPHYPSPLARRVAAFVGRHCGPTAKNWRRKLVRWLTAEIGGGLQVGQPITRDLWNARWRDFELVAAKVLKQPRKKAPGGPKSESNVKP